MSYIQIRHFDPAVGYLGSWDRGRDQYGRDEAYTNVSVALVHVRYKQSLVSDTPTTNF